jgi:hypothetical protein
MACLQTGVLADLREAVAADSDLNLEIRDNYLNVYYKGQSLLMLRETKRLPRRYPVRIDGEFTAGLNLPTDLSVQTAVSQFVSAIPSLKAAIAAYRNRSIELEYEQLVIRANNHESHNNSEYFIVDRQYTWPAGRCDLVGLFWKRAGRRRGQEVPLCLFEVKYGLNSDISDLAGQLQRYYDALRPQAGQVAAEMEEVFRQKLALGLYRHPQDRLAAMQTLRVIRDIHAFQFVVLLVDYNPNSKLLNMAALKALLFAPQIRLLQAGLALWQTNVKPLDSQ